jgi:chromosome segregation ATPase
VRAKKTHKKSIFCSKKMIFSLFFALSLQLTSGKALALLGSGAPIMGEAFGAPSGAGSLVLGNGANAQLFSQVKQHAEAISHETQSLKLDNDALVHKLEHADLQLTQLTRELAEQTARCCELAALLDQERTAYESLSFDQLANRTALEQMERQLALVEAAAARADKDARSVRELTTQHATALANVRNRTAHLDLRLNDALARAAALDAQLRDAHRACDHAVMAKDSAVAQLQHEAQRCRELGDALQHASSAAATAARDSDALRAQLLAVSDAKQRADAEHAAEQQLLQHQAAQLAAQLADAGAQLHAEKSAAAAAAHAAALELHEHDTVCAAAETELAGLHAALEKARAEISESAAQKQAINGAFEKHMQTLRNAHSNEISRISAQCDALAAERDAARDAAAAERDAALAQTRTTASECDAARAALRAAQHRMRALEQAHANALAAAAAAPAPAPPAAPSPPPAAAPQKEKEKPKTSGAATTASAKKTPLKSAPAATPVETPPAKSTPPKPKTFSRKKPASTVSSIPTPLNKTSKKSAFESVIAPNSVFAFDD